MLNFLRKKDSSKNFSPFLNIRQDIHSHILPGIDDGSPDVSISLKLIKGMCSLGIKKAVATPHIIGDMYRNTPETINAALEKIKTASKEQQLDIELSAAAEYMVDDHFISLLRRKEKLLTLDKNFILTEFSYSTMPQNVEEILFEIITEGYQPLLAHPERYFYYHKNFKIYHRLKEMGFLLQVNLLSLTGYYGLPVAKAAKYIFENGLADFVGTDMHHERHLRALLNKENTLMLNKFLEEKKFNDFDIVGV